MSDYERKFIGGELKAEGEHTFSGIASPYGNVDQGGDIVMRGSYTRTLDQNGKERPILWQHDARSPVGLGHFEDSEKALLLKRGEFEMALRDAPNAYAAIKSNIVRGLSIGYMPVKWEWQKSEDPDGWPVRLLKEVRLFEVSIVTFPMNESAVITAVKNGPVTAMEFWNLEIKSGRLDPTLIRPGLNKLTALLDEKQRQEPALNPRDSGDHSRLQALFDEAMELAKWNPKFSKRSSAN